jgi:hypothetical protein
MNLFSKPKAPEAPEPAPRPDFDEAQQRVDEQVRQRRMRGRSQAMLSQRNEQAPTAMRQVTGN